MGFVAVPVGNEASNFLTPELFFIAAAIVVGLAVVFEIDRRFLGLAACVGLIAAMLTNV